MVDQQQQQVLALALVQDVRLRKQVLGAGVRERERQDFGMMEGHPLLAGVTQVREAILRRAARDLIATMRIAVPPDGQDKTLLLISVYDRGAFATRHYKLPETLTWRDPGLMAGTWVEHAVYILPVKQ